MHKVDTPGVRKTVMKAAPVKYTLKMLPKMPSTTHSTPAFDLGKCRIYASLSNKTWRVKPDPEKYANDKVFCWKGNPKAAWKDVIAYCKSPKIPKTWKPKE